MFTENLLYPLLHGQGMAVERDAFPCSDTQRFRKENLMRLFHMDRVFLPFYGNLMIIYARTMTRDEARQTLSHLAASPTAVMGPLN